MSMNTPLGSIQETTPINSFKELASIELNQYLLGINNILQGDGAKITLQNLIKGIISTDENNLIALDNKGRLIVTSGAFNLDTGWAIAPNLTIDWSAGIITGVGGVFYLNGVILTALSNFLVSDLPTDIGQHFLYYNSQSGEFEWSVGYPTIQSDYIHNIIEIVISADGNKFAIQTWEFGGMSKELIDYLNNTIGMTILEGGNIRNIILDNTEKRKPVVSKTKIGVANFNQTFKATQAGEAYTLAHANDTTIVFETSKTEIVPIGSSGMAQYLSNNGLTDLEADKFMNVWLFALPTVSTSPSNMNYLYITGSGQYDTLVRAKAADFNEDKTIKVLSENFYRYCPIARFTIQNSENNFSIVDYANIGSTSGGLSTGSLSTGGYGLEVGDISTALYVNEAKNLRRYLNGQIVDNNKNTKVFIEDYLLGLYATNPEYFTTEDNWQAEATLNIDGCVYKFVLNYASDGETVVSVRLPKYPDYVEINTLNIPTTIPVVGNGLGLGLTNGTLYGALADWSSPGNLAVSPNQYGAAVGAARNSYTTSQSVFGVTTDAKKSGLVGKLTNNSKQTKLKMRYFIQIATGSETEANIVNTLENVNGFTLLESKYSDKPLYNESWLLSNGQWNSKAVYPTVYEGLQVEYNTEIEAGTTVTLPSGVSYTKRGLSVKLSTEEYTDYDFVLNTAEETFRLPLLDGSENLIGDKYTNYEIGPSGQEYTATHNGYVSVLKTVNTGVVNLYNSTQEHANTTSFQFYASVDNSTIKMSIKVNRGDKFKFQYTAPTTNSYSSMTLRHNKGNGSLYYYIGDIDQNHGIVNMGRIGEQLATKASVDDIDGAFVKAVLVLVKGTTYTVGTTHNTKTLVQFDISNYLPQDSNEYDYEVRLSSEGYATNTSAMLWINTPSIADISYGWSDQANTSCGSVGSVVTQIIPKGYKKISIYLRSSSSSMQLYSHTVGYRRLRKGA